MITADTRVIGVPPNISAASFAQRLTEANSPAAPEAAASYAAIVQEGIDPLFALAVFEHESNMATNPAAVVVTWGTKNPGNTRTSRTGVSIGIVQTSRGPFVKYNTWTDGWRDLARRLTDPTFVYAERGEVTPGAIIPTWAPASDNNDPAAYIAAVVESMNQWEEAVTPPVAEGSSPMVNIVDIRSQLHTDTSPGHGPNAKSAKDGVIVHYNGPPPNADAVTQYKNDAVYHANLDWGGGNFGDGIMYHYGIGQDGTIYQLRNADAVLWHCASWPENATYTAINVNIGEGQHASAAAIASLTALVGWLRQRDGFGSDAVKGHQEVSSTACPGTLMQDFVLPYRAGQIAASVPPPAAPQVDTERSEFPTGKILRKGNGFRNQWDAVAAIGTDANLRLMGEPVTDEYVMQFTPGQDSTVQLFERNGLEWNGGNAAPWDITALPLDKLIAAIAEADKRGLRYKPV